MFWVQFTRSSCFNKVYNNSTVFTYVDVEDIFFGFLGHGKHRFAFFLIYPKKKMVFCGFSRIFNRVTSQNFSS